MPSSALCEFMTGLAYEPAVSIVVDNAKRHNSLQRKTSTVSESGESVSSNGTTFEARWDSIESGQGECPMCPKRRISDPAFKHFQMKHEKLPVLNKARALPDFDRFGDDSPCSGRSESVTKRRSSSLDLILTEAIDLCDP